MTKTPSAGKSFRIIIRIVLKVRMGIYLINIRLATLLTIDPHKTEKVT